MNDAEKLAALYARAADLSIRIARNIRRNERHSNDVHVPILAPVASKEKLSAVAKLLGWKDVDILPTGVIGDEPRFLNGELACYSADQYFPTISENLADAILNVKVNKARAKDPYDTRGHAGTWE